MLYNKRINYILVGVFVIAMLIAGLIFLALLGGRAGPSDAYYVVLENVADVKFGTQVRYEGYPIGQVEAITPLPEAAGMRFRVDVSAAQGWRLPADSVARIGSSSFLAAKTIDITGGRRKETIPPGGQIASAPPVDIFSAITTTAAEIGELNRGSVRPLLDNLNDLVETMNRDAPRITGQLAVFAESLNASLVPLQQILAEGNIESVEHSIANMEETTRTLAEASHQAAEIMRKVDHLAANLDDLVESNRPGVEQSLTDLQHSLASIARSVDSIVHNFEATARNMNEFSRLIRGNPGLLLDGRPRPAVSPATSPAHQVER